MLNRFYVTTMILVDLQCRPPVLFPVVMQRSNIDCVAVRRQCEVSEVDTGCGNDVVRALASHHCGPGSIPGPGVTCVLSLFLVPVPAPRVFLRVLRIPSSTKTNTPNSNSMRAFDHHVMLKCALQISSIYLFTDSEEFVPRGAVRGYSGDEMCKLR